MSYTSTASANSVLEPVAQPAGHGDKIAGRNAVAAIKVDDRAQGVDIYGIAEYNHIVGHNAIPGHTGRRAIGRVAITPNLGGRLLRMGDINFKAIFPMVVIKDRVIRDDGNRDVSAVNFTVNFVVRGSLGGV